jgi:hypothetical protein
MLTVRYPNGVSITYNTANFLRYTPSSWELYTRDPANGGTWVASLMPSANAIVEATPACKMENPVENLTGEAALREVSARIRSFRNGGGRHLAEMKRALADFNARHQQWK